MTGGASISVSSPMRCRRPPTAGAFSTSCEKSTRCEELTMKIQCPVGLVVFLLSTLAYAAQESSPSLEARITPLVKAHHGQVAVAVKHLDFGDELYLNADEPMPTASLIKFMVMLEVYQQVLEGKIKL